MPTPTTPYLCQLLLKKVLCCEKPNPSKIWPPLKMIKYAKSVFLTCRTFWKRLTFVIVPSLFTNSAAWLICPLLNFKQFSLSHPKAEFSMLCIFTSPFLDLFWKTDRGRNDKISRGCFSIHPLPSSLDLWKWLIPQCCLFTYSRLYIQFNNSLKNTSFKLY